MKVVRWFPLSLFLFCGCQSFIEIPFTIINSETGCVIQDRTHEIVLARPRYVIGMPTFSDLLRLCNIQTFSNLPCLSDYYVCQKPTRNGSYHLLKTHAPTDIRLFFLSEGVPFLGVGALITSDAHSITVYASPISSLHNSYTLEGWEFFLGELIIARDSMLTDEQVAFLSLYIHPKVSQSYFNEIHISTQSLYERVQDSAITIKCEP